MNAQKTPEDGEEKKATPDKLKDENDEDKEEGEEEKEGSSDESQHEDLIVKPRLRTPS